MDTHGWLKSLIMLATSDDVQYSGMFVITLTNCCACVTGFEKSPLLHAKNLFNFIA